MITKRFAGLGVATLLALAACGSDDSSDTGTTSAGTAGTTAVAPTTAAPTTTATAPDEATATSAEDATTAASGGGDAVVATAQSDLGTILVDAEGRTLYGFKPDTAGEPTCVDSCAETWPPAFVEGEVAVGDLDASVFTLVEHPAGGQQLKAGDWPLYLFASDAAPGDVNGQGVGGNWFVVAPDGTLIED